MQLWNSQRALVPVATSLVLLFGAFAIGRPAFAETLFRANLEGVEGYELLIWTNDFPAGSATDLHHHGGHEFLYVLEGEVQVRVGEETKIYASGQLIHVPVGTSMKVSNVGARSAKTLVYMLAKEGTPLKTKE